MSTNKSVLVVQEIDEILKKCAIKTFQEDGIHFLNSIFVVPKMESEGRPMLYLKILLKKLYVRLIIFPKGILLMASSREEMALARDALIYCLQNLGFLMNVNKFSTLAMSEFAIFGHRNQLRRHDLDPSKRRRRL